MDNKHESTNNDRWRGLTGEVICSIPGIIWRLGGSGESLRGRAERYSEAVYCKDEQLDMRGRVACNSLLRRTNEALVMNLLR